MVFSQNNPLDTMSENNYKRYFPLGIQEALFLPAVDMVYILPTNEKNKKLQKQEVSYFIDKITKEQYGIVKFKSRIVTDKEALKMDLSNVNIRTMGTLEGNLWTKQYLFNNKDFPIKIYKDSIVTDTVYKGNDYLISALWFNPLNYKHSVVYTIPQDQKNYKFNFGYDIYQYLIYKNGVSKPVKESFYCQIKGSQFLPFHDSQLLNDFINKKTINLKTLSGPICKYPELKDLDSCLFSQNEISVDTLKIEDINRNYDNISDMEWLKPVADEYKVVAVGEHHHLSYNSYFQKKILFALNTYSYFPYLVIELPYSYGEFVNYYLAIKDDEQAEKFWQTVMCKFFKFNWSLFPAIRDWNKLHPEKTIKVGCSDLEHEYMSTIKNILVPYFKKVDPTVNLRFNKDSIDYFFSKAEELLNQAKKNKIIGAYPFINAAYIENVIENLKPTIKYYKGPHNNNDFGAQTFRFGWMIRNLTDKKFLGNYIRKEKVMMWGGAIHFYTRKEFFNNWDNRNKTEGYYLMHQFKPTKNKVYSIHLNTIGLSVKDSIRQIDPRLGFLVEPQLIKLCKEHVISYNEPVVYSNVTELQNFILKLSYSYPQYAFRIKDLELNKISNKKFIGGNGFTALGELVDLTDFNTTIFVPYSPIGEK